MIKIKFRAWDKERSQMHYVDQIHFGHGGAPTVTTWVQDFRGSQRLLVFGENAELMQFTGLTDKNGKEIWRGDIIRMAPATKPALVLWNEKYASFALDQEGWVYNHFFGEAVDSDKCEVIGNIYENPELLS